MTDATTKVICPVCDAPNAARSLFCAECGTPLGPDDGDSATTRPEPRVPDSQSTAVIPSNRTWGDTGVTASASETRQATTVAPLAISPTGEPNPYLPHPPQYPESRRGFWLGFVALILILIVLGLWIWGGVLAADTRNSITDLFS